MDINLTDILRKKMAPRVRVRGRYNSSEMYFIVSGKTTPEEWLHSPEKRTDELLNMWNGTGVHNQLEGLLGEENCEKKVEFVYRDIVLVAKLDFDPPGLPDEVWEFKSSEKLMTSAKPWHKHQVKLYCTMFKKKKGIIYQPLQDDNGIYLKDLGSVERDDKWFEKQLELLYSFHEKVEKLYEKEGLTKR